MTSREHQKNDKVVPWHESWEENMVQARPIEQYRVNALRRHGCELVEVAQRESNAERRDRLLELAASFLRSATAVEYEA